MEELYIAQLRMDCDLSRTHCSVGKAAARACWAEVEKDIRLVARLVSAALAEHVEKNPADAKCSSLGGARSEDVGAVREDEDAGAGECMCCCRSRKNRRRADKPRDADDDAEVEGVGGGGIAKVVPFAQALSRATEAKSDNGAVEVLTVPSSPQGPSRGSPPAK